MRSETFNNRIARIAKLFETKPEWMFTDLYRATHVAPDAIREVLQWLVNKQFLLKKTVSTSGRPAEVYTSNPLRDFKQVGEYLEELRTELKPAIDSNLLMEIKKKNRELWQGFIKQQEEIKHVAGDVVARVWAIAENGEKEENRIKALTLLGQHFNLWSGDTNSMVAKFVFVGKDGQERETLVDAFRERLQELKAPEAEVVKHGNEPGNEPHRDQRLPEPDPQTSGQ